MRLTTDVLETLDRERRAAGEPSRNGSVVRELSSDGSECRIGYSHCAAEEIEAVISDEISSANSAGHTLEWKVYGHDVPPNLVDCLLAAGFVPDDMESVLMLAITEESLAAFDAPGYEIKRVLDTGGVNDVAEISHEIGLKNVEEEKRQLEVILRESPHSLSIHVAYFDGVPVACGRTHFSENCDCAELAGGRTKTTHRNRGIFTALVAERLREAMARNRTHDEPVAFRGQSK